MQFFTMAWLLWQVQGFFQCWCQTGASPFLTWVEHSPLWSNRGLVTRVERISHVHAVESAQFDGKMPKNSQSRRKACTLNETWFLVRMSVICSSLGRVGYWKSLFGSDLWDVIWRPCVRIVGISHAFNRFSRVVVYEENRRRSFDPDGLKGCQMG